MAKSEFAFQPCDWKCIISLVGRFAPCELLPVGITHAASADPAAACFPLARLLHRQRAFFFEGTRPVADRTVVLSQNGRHAVRGLSVNNPSEFSAYQDDDDDLTYVVDLSAYLDGDTITVVTRVPQGVFISNSSNTTTRLTQRLRGFGYVDFKVQTSAGDVEEFRINILRRTGSKVVLGASGGGGTAVTDGDYGDIVVSGGGSVWSIDAGVIVDADINASAAIAPTKLAFTQSGAGAVTRTVDSKLKDEISIRDWGGTHDGQQFFGVAAMTSGSATLTVTGANFVAGDVGKLAYVRGAGAAGATLATTVSARVSATQLTLAASASTTVSNQDCIIATNNATEVNAADAVAGAKWLPEGLTGSNVAFNSLDGPYYGRGQIVDNLGNKHAPWIRRVTAPPSLPANAPLHADSISTAFNGDMSNVQIAMEHYVTGATTLGQPTTGYRHNPECSAVLVDVYNSSGYNHSTTGDVGRTQVNAFHCKVRQYGQGDVVPFLVLGIGGSNNPSATNWAANPAVGAFAADLQAGVNYIYLNPLELNCIGNAYTCSAVGGVYNFFREVDSEGGQAHFWSGVRVNSQGSQSIDVGLQAFGKIKFGLDLSYGDFGANLAAITLKANQRIYGNVTATDGSSRFPTALNTDYFAYQSGISGWNFVTASQSALQITQLQVTLPAPGQLLRISGATSGNTALQASATASGTLTLPAATDTLVGRATTDTLSNKTLSAPTISGDLTSNGWATFASANAFAPQLTAWNQAAGTSGGYFKLRKSRGVSGAGSATVASDTLGSFLWSGHDTTGTEQNAAYISVTALTVGASSVTAFLQFNANGGNFTFGNGGANILDIAGAGEYRMNGTKVVGARQTGWAAATGTATRTTFDTATVTTAQLAERVKALIDNLITHGLIGA